MIIDAWAQHPTLRHLQDPIFASLLRWTRSEAPTEAPPVSATIAAMDAAQVCQALICAWVAPGKVMISSCPRRRIAGRSAAGNGSLPCVTGGG